MKKILNLTKLIALGLFASVNFLAATSCRSSTTIVYGNYENYMSTDLMREISHADDVKFDYYGNDGNLEANFKNNIFDIGTVSISTMVKMQKKGLLKQLDWSEFNLETPKQDGTSCKVKNAADATKLFTDPVNDVLCSYRSVCPNLLQWGIPYFIQSFVFVYWTNPALNFNNVRSWKDILNTIKKNYTYFNNNQLTCVEDPMTLFTLSKLVHDDSRSRRLTQADSIKETLKKYNDIFSSFTSILNKHNFRSSSNVMLLNSDSYFSVNKIAKHEVNGAFMFNGDALFAATGGEFMGRHPPLPGTNFFVAIPTTPVALDMIVVNKNTAKNKFSRINKVIRKIALNAKRDSKTNQMSGSTWQNFQSVMYTSPLQVIQDYIASDWKWVDQNDSWKNATKDIQDNINTELTKIYNIPDKDHHVYEPFLSDEQKATLALAFAQFKESL